jgi:two-component system, CitB family, sensor kinase
MRKRLNVAQQVFALTFTVIFLLVGTGAFLVFWEVRRDVRAHAEDRVLTLASALAELPEVGEALAEPEPAEVTARLQPLATSVRVATGTDFIVFMTPDRIRYTHPVPERVGRPFVGTVAPALEGHAFTETYEGTLGPSVRAVVPVLDGEGELTALLSIGILQDKIGSELRRRLSPVVFVSAGALLVAAAGSYAVSRRLDRQTLGLGPEQLTRLYEHHDAVLHAVREGLLIVSPRGELVLANDQARRLLGLGDDPEGRPVTALGLHPPMARLLTSGEPVTDRLCVYADRVLVANQEPIEHDGRRLGTVTTLRDHTELEALAGELDSERGFTEALRSQAHESANRLHTVVTLVELGKPEQAVEFATGELASAQALTDRLTDAVEEPALAALLLGKAAQAAEKGVEFTVTEDTAVAPGRIAARDLVTLVGNLVNNAIDAALAGPPPRRVTVTARSEPGAAGQLLVRVADSGRGVDSAHLGDIFGRGWTTKPAVGPHGQGLGLALVRQVIDRYGGEVEVGSGPGGGAVFTVRLRPGTDAGTGGER